MPPSKHSSSSHHSSHSSHSSHRSSSSGSHHRSSYGSSHYRDRSYYNGYTGSNRRASGCGSVIAVIFLVGAFLFVKFDNIRNKIVQKFENSATTISTQVDKSDKKENNDKNSIYVEAIGRSCDWNDEYDSYYDPETDCYFWYNTDISTPCWQYWYEDISSDYGDYGWMEYDEKECEWYIEDGKNNWVKLPSMYDTSELWYIAE